MLKAIKDRFVAFISSEVKTDEERIHLQYVVILEILCTVSFFMSVFNMFTKWYSLASFTFVFGILLAVYIMIEKGSKEFRTVGRLSFIFEMILLFTAFTIIGEPEGFSAIWVLLVPSCGFFLFRMRHGLEITGAQLLILIFLLWTPIGNSLLQYEYTATFKMRFPVVYVAFSFVGILLEVVRLHSTAEMEKAKEEYKYMYNHDALTGLYNRYGFNTSIEEYCEKREDGAIALAILDLDHFKDVNDQYGHVNGDEVLKEMARRIDKCIGESGVVSRWGGEEFSILFLDTAKAEEKVNKLINIARAVPIDLKDGKSVIVTFSMGIVVAEKDQKVDSAQLIRLADKLLYTAKEVGRNQIIKGEYNENL